MFPFSLLCQVMSCRFIYIFSYYSSLSSLNLSLSFVKRNINKPQILRSLGERPPHPEGGTTNHRSAPAPFPLLRRRPKLNLFSSFSPCQLAFSSFLFFFYPLVPTTRLPKNSHYLFLSQQITSQHVLVALLAML